MPQATNYDAIVIGTSQGGRLLPIAFAKAGRKVALIERGHLGGICVNVGCTPTKTMVASARVAYLARRGADYGVHTGPTSVDMQAIRKRKQGIVEGARSAFESRIEATQGLDLLIGEAHFIAPKTLEVYLGPPTKFATLSELGFANRLSRKIDAKPANRQDGGIGSEAKVGRACPISSSTTLVRDELQRAPPYGSWLANPLSRAHSAIWKREGKPNFERTLLI